MSWLFCNRINLVLFDSWSFRMDSKLFFIYMMRSLLSILDKKYISLYCLGLAAFIFTYLPHFIYRFLSILWSDHSDGFSRPKVCFFMWLPVDTQYIEPLVDLVISDNVFCYLLSLSPFPSCTILRMSYSIPYSKCS